MWEPPVVDMESPEAPKVLAKACKDVGFFYVENHGVSKDAMREVFRQSKAFFSLGIDDKMAVKADRHNRGFTPMHEEILDPSKQVKGDTKEGYYIFRELPTPSDGEEDAARPLKGPNQWPSEDLVPGWRATMQSYFTTMHAVGVRLSGLLSVGLGLDPSFFESCTSEMAHALRLLHYSAEVSMTLVVPVDCRTSVERNKSRLFLTKWRPSARRSLSGTAGAEEMSMSTTGGAHIVLPLLPLT